MLVKNFKYLIWFKIICLFLGSSIFAYTIFNHTKISSKEKKNIIFLIDISNSMNVEDIEWKYWINRKRLDVWKKIIEDNIFEIKKNGNKVWIVLMNRDINYLVAPTDDLENLLIYLESTNTWIGNNWNFSLIEKLNEFLSSWINNTNIIFLSDLWDENIEDNLNIRKNIQQNLAEKNNNLNVLWLWTEIWWYVRNNLWDFIFIDWEKIKSKINNKLWDDLNKNIYVTYQTINSIEKIWEIDLWYNIHKNNNNNNQILILIWALFLILWI